MQTFEYIVTISLPCWGRPERTKRAVECILSQEMNGWEALITGDGCPHFQNLIDSGWMEEKASIAHENGNSLVYKNLDKNHGGCGYVITNENIQAAKGKYIVFYANDDIILPSHLSTYVSKIDKEGVDYMYFDSYLDPTSKVRIARPAPSQIGHSEIIVKTELAKKAPPHSPNYGHDWDFIHFIMKNAIGS